MATLKSYLDAQSTPERLAAMRTAIAELLAEVSELSLGIEAMDKVLAPFWDRERQIHAAIIDTFGTTRFSWANREERKPLYEALLQISLDCGKLRGGRKEANSLRKSYERDVARLAKEIKFLEKRKGRQHAKFDEEGRA